MRDVARDRGEQRAERAFYRWPLERAVAHAGADAQPAVLRLQYTQRGDLVDIDEVRRRREA